MSRTSLALRASVVVALAAAGLGVPGCRRTSDVSGVELVDAAAMPSGISRDVVPPAAPFNATPAADLADAENVDAKPPYERANVYFAQGQLWMARLALEGKALGSDGTREETELLVRICQDQADAACVDVCAKKLGRKIKMPDGGAPAPRPLH